MPAATDEREHVAGPEENERHSLDSLGQSGITGPGS